VQHWLAEAQPPDDAELEPTAEGELVVLETPANQRNPPGAGVGVVDWEAPPQSTHVPSQRATAKRAAHAAAPAIDVDSEGDGRDDTSIPATPAPMPASQSVEVVLTDAGPADPVAETPLPVLHYEPADDALWSLPLAPFAWATPLPRAPASPSAAATGAATPTPDSLTRGVLHYSPTRTSAESTRHVEPAGPAEPPPVTPLVGPTCTGETPNYRAFATGNLKARCVK